MTIDLLKKPNKHILASNTVDLWNVKERPEGLIGIDRSFRSGAKDANSAIEQPRPGRESQHGSVGDHGYRVLLILRHRVRDIERDDPTTGIAFGERERECSQLHRASKPTYLVIRLNFLSKFSFGIFYFQFFV